MNPQLELRNARKEDLPLIVELLRKSNLPCEDIPSKLDCMFIAHFGEKIIGLGGVEIYGMYGLLRSVVIKEDFRGKGYGRRLCLKLIERARQRGVKDLYLLTTTAEEFFRKLGFSVVDRDGAPEVIRKTDEFHSLCPSTAVCMVKKL